MKDLGAECFRRRERAAIEDAQCLTKLDSAEIPHIKKSAFAAGVNAKV